MEPGVPEEARRYGERCGNGGHVFGYGMKGPSEGQGPDSQPQEENQDGRGSSMVLDSSRSGHGDEDRGQTQEGPLDGLQGLEGWDGNDDQWGRDAVDGAGGGGEGGPGPRMPEEAKHGRGSGTDGNGARALRPALGTITIRYYQQLHGDRQGRLQRGLQGGLEGRRPSSPEPAVVIFGKIGWRSGHPA
jgi:hypothetical protein